MKRYCLVLFMLILVISSLFNAETVDASKYEPMNKGKITIKYTAKDTNFDKATKSQLKILKKIGWKKVDGQWVMYRDAEKFIQKAIKDKMMPTYEQAQEIEKKVSLMSKNDEDNHKHVENTVKVNGKEVEIKDGTFKVEGGPEVIDVFFDEKNQSSVKKNANGEYNLVITQDVGEMIDEMENHEHAEAHSDSHHHMAVQALSYGKYYKKGDWVHCNRFNGPWSNNQHLPKTNPQAIINFALSDCDYGATRYCRNHANCNQKYRAAYCSYKLGHSTKYHKH